MRKKSWLTVSLLGALAMGAAAQAESVKIPASADNENTYAHSSKLPLEQAVAIALAQVPGRVLWAGMENYDGKLHSMVQVVRDDRSQKVVTLDSGSGAVESVSDLKQKKKKEGAKDKKDIKKAPVEAVKGSTRIGSAKTAEWPFLAKVSLDQAMKTALAKQPGKYVEIYLFDKGGFLFYGIEISSPQKQIIKLDIDAGTGNIYASEKM